MNEIQHATSFRDKNMAVVCGIVKLIRRVDARASIREDLDTPAPFAELQ